MWRRHTSLILGLGTLLLAGTLIFVAILPMYNTTTSLFAQIERKTKERDDLLSQVSVLSQLDMGVTESRVGVLDAALPPKKDVVLYLSAIDGLARELNLSFGGISLIPGELGETKGVAGLQSLDTEIKIQGNKESIYTFLQTVEQVLPLMEIKDVKVSVAGDEQYSLSLRLGMLWAQPKSAGVAGKIGLFNSEDEKYFAQLSGYRRFVATGETLPVVGNKQDLFASGETVEEVVTPQP